MVSVSSWAGIAGMPEKKRLTCVHCNVENDSITIRFIHIHRSKVLILLFRTNNLKRQNENSILLNF